MAGNFWKSSHYEQWILEKYDLLRERGDDLKIYSEDEYQKILIFFCNFMHTLGTDYHQQGKFHQQVIATACVYFRRFYARRSFKDIDPFLLAPTCLVLAAKVEEQGMHTSGTKFLQYVQQTIHKKYSFMDVNIKSAHMQEAEFFLLEILDCCLIVYLPYRPLLQLVQDMRALNLRDVDLLYHDAWRVVNDSLRTDAALLYAPHIIAIASVMIACMFSNGEKYKEKEMRTWLSEFSVDLEKVFEVMELILNMYKLVKTYDEKEQIEGLLKRLPLGVFGEVKGGFEQSAVYLPFWMINFTMGVSTSKNPTKLATCPMPVFTVKNLGPRHVLVAGGGGAAKTGVSNQIRIYLLTYNPHHESGPHSTDGLPPLLGVPVSKTDTSTAAVMNADVICLEGDERFLVATGEDENCALYVTSDYSLQPPIHDKDDQDGKTSPTPRLALNLKRSPSISYRSVERGSIPDVADGRIRNNGNRKPTLIHEFNLDGGCVDDVDFSVDGTVLAAVTDKWVGLLSLKNSRSLFPLPSPGQIPSEKFKVRSIRFTNLGNQTYFAVAYQQRNRRGKQTSFVALWRFNGERFSLANARAIKDVFSTTEGTEKKTLEFLAQPLNSFSMRFLHKSN
ncbi:Cyclin-C [Aphelenchoides besseyi]|nr:Cyclin-C [Aphelenchoides besseyi]